MNATDPGNQLPRFPRMDFENPSPEQERRVFHDNLNDRPADGLSVEVQEDIGEITPASQEVADRIALEDVAGYVVATATGKKEPEPTVRQQPEQRQRSAKRAPKGKAKNKRHGRNNDGSVDARTLTVRQRSKL